VTTWLGLGVASGGPVLARVQATLGIIGLVALGVTYVIVSGRNPLPAAGKAVTAWLADAGSLSKPEAAWVQRLDDKPTTAALVGGAVVFTTLSGADVRDARDGRPLWKREARWVAVAGDVVVLGKGRRDGYDVVDPMSGAVRWHDGGVGVWAYRDALLSLSCPSGRGCVLSARSTVDGAVRWSSPLPAGASTLDGAHGSAAGLPPLLGLRIGDRLHVVETAGGGQMHEEEITDGRATVLGTRIVRSTAVRRDGNCRYGIEAQDMVTGRVVWRKDGYDLGTASGIDCEQRRDPAGGRQALVAAGGQGQPVLLSIVDGSQLWSGTPGDKVLAADGQGVVVRSADCGSVTLVDLDGRVRWTRPARSGVTLTADAVVVTDAGAGRLIAYDRAGGGTIADVASQASVLGSGPAGLVLALDRTAGVLPLAASRR
jgi:outer membrane protein assembly factor BamB